MRGFIGHFRKWNPAMWVGASGLFGMGAQSDILLLNMFSTSMISVMCGLSLFVTFVHPESAGKS